MSPRAKALLAGLGPLVGLFLFVLVFAPPRPLKELVFGTCLFGLGPIGPPVLLLRWPIVAVLAVFLTLWGGYALALIFTRAGRIDWRLHLAGAAMWCVFGVCGVVVAGLRVT